MSAGNVFWQIASQCVRDVLCLTTKPGRTLAVLGTLHCSLLILFCSLGCMRWCGLAVSPFIALIGRGSRSVLVNTKAAVPMNVWELTSNSVLGEEELQQWQYQWMWFFHNTGEKSVKKGSSLWLKPAGLFMNWSKWNLKRNRAIYVVLPWCKRKAHVGCDWLKRWWSVTEL